MDIAEQLQRLLDLAEQTRRRAAELATTEAGAIEDLDVAAYDLKRLIDDVREILEPAQGAGDATLPPGRAFHRRTGS